MCLFCRAAVRTFHPSRPLMAGAHASALIRVLWTCHLIAEEAEQVITFASLMHRRGASAGAAIACSLQPAAQARAKLAATVLFCWVCCFLWTCIIDLNEKGLLNCFVYCRSLRFKDIKCNNNRLYDYYYLLVSFNELIGTHTALVFVILGRQTELETCRTCHRWKKFFFFFFLFFNDFWKSSLGQLSIKQTKHLHLQQLCHNQRHQMRQHF